ncbi:hypothetical protein Pla123a_03830 [Posidoniimonas polymericola]|uniref:Uncharacterized protein n=1 Tax=Posidoniimonas polymericola TaxID=2528002 RepID=A0A5C5ZEJ2_9BACT|nr:hypothetical protein [Posidoniimonas polymericola]TWT85576.1 hypothetical protein Pla123a_03830 [Posidoniimonas polymericola]
MPITNTDAVLWYNVGVFGDAGYAVPNWSNDVGSLNPQVLDWVELVGRNLFHIMHHEDADLRIPPSINTCKRVHKLYLRAANILAGRAVPAGVDNMEVRHARPAGEVFRVYPVPYFKVRNPFLRRWAGLILVSLSEAMQHTENRKEMEISTAFAGTVGQYVRRVYTNMAIELFGKTREAAIADGFALTDADLAAYNPGAFFTSTEMVDTVPRLDRVFTEDRLEVLAEGISVTELPADIGPWPTNLTNFYSGVRSDGVMPGATSGGSGATAAPIIPPAP